MDIKEILKKYIEDFNDNELQKLYEYAVHIHTKDKFIDKSEQIENVKQISPMYGLNPKF